MIYKEFCKGLRGIVEKVTIKGFISEKKREVDFFCRSGALERYANEAGVSISIKDKSYCGFFKTICFIHNGCEVEFADLVDREQVVKPRRLGISFKHEFDTPSDSGDLIWDEELEKAVIALHKDALVRKMAVKMDEADWLKKKLDPLLKEITKIKEEIIDLCNEEKELTTNIGNLKVSGSAEDIHKLARIYGLAACEYGNQIIEEIHGKHQDNLIAELESEQRYLENIEKQLIDAIRDTTYYKKHSSEMLVMIDSILEEIEKDER